MSDAASARSNADRNLLFGILAYQNALIGKEALITGMQAWLVDKAKPLAQILVEHGALRPKDRELLEPLVRRHLEVHGEDPAKSLANLSSIGSLRPEVERIADADLHASLMHVSAAHKTEDPYATQPGSVSAPRPAGPRFRILRSHAKGGLGQVYVARDEELGRQVALKEIREHHADDPASRARFVLEAEITGGLEHPGIVPVYGLGTYADGRPFYAMRFIRGDSLQEAIDQFHRADTPGRDPRERNLALRGLLGRFIDVCNAVAYAHSRGVLHRDLKPGNVMLGPYGETLVVDWGLAKLLGQVEAGSPEGPLTPSAAGAVTPTAGPVGTPAYMSPEQAAGRLDQLGPAADVYSLGATLYCLLVGRTPLSAQNAGIGYARLEKGKILRPRQVSPAVPPALEAVCLKALALRPKDRYTSPAALAADVERWLADEPVAAYREPWSTRTRRWLKRHRTLASGAAAAVTVAGVSLALATGLLAQANANERSAKLLAQEQEQQAQKERQRAEESYRLARNALTQCLKVREDPRLRSGDLEDLQRLLAQAEAAFYQEYVQLRGDGLRFQFEHGVAYSDLARVTADLGSTDAAIQHYLQALAIVDSLPAQFPSEAAHERARAKIHNQLGRLYARGGQRDAAEQAYRIALEIKARLAKQYPTNTDLQDALAEVYYDMGYLLYRHTRGRLGEAETALKEAVAIMERLAQLEPAVAARQQNLATSMGTLAKLYGYTGRAMDALPLHERCVRICEGLVKQQPGVAQYEYDLATSHHALAKFYSIHGRREARNAYLKALPVYERLTSQHPLVSEYAVNLASCQTGLGDTQAGNSEAPEAVEWCTKAIRTLAPVLQRDPRSADARNQLSSAHWKRAQASMLLGRHAEALRDWERVLELEAGPTRGWVRLQRAVTLARLGDHAKATAEVAELLASKGLGGHFGNLFLYDAARVFARSTAVVREAKLREQYAVQAVQFLKQAQAAGQFNSRTSIEGMKKDHDFQPILRRPDFQKLLADLEKATKK
jgi:serine/threonine-protein kinase